MTAAPAAPEAPPAADAAEPLILLVEDEPIFQQQFGQAVAELNGPWRLQVCDTGRMALQEVERPGRHWALALVDLNLPDISGIEVIRALHARWPELPSLVATIISQEQTLISAIRAGARGYILKSDEVTPLKEAIRQVLAGLYPVSPSLARALFRLAGSPLPADDATAAAPTMTPKELEVLRQLSLGHSYKEVARHLGIALSTVQSHVSSIYRKLGAHSQVQAVLEAQRTKLI